METGPIMAMDYDFHLLGEIPHYTSLTVKREFWDAGSFKLVFPYGRDGFGPLARDRILYMPSRPAVAMIVTKLSKTGGKITADGTLLKGLAKRRICVPPLNVDAEYQAFGYDLYTGDAESAYLHYAANNLTSPEDEKRRMPYMILAENQYRGMTLPWAARFENLCDFFGEIGEGTGIGWDIRPDFAQKQYVFEVAEGVDRTSGTARAALSRELGNAGDATITDDATAAATVIYAGGGGEDENRLILSYGNELEGLARYEQFADCGSVTDTDMLDMAAVRKMSAIKRTMTVSVLESGLCRYERDYDLGDRVTCIAEDWRMDAQLIAMEEVYEGGHRTLKATFGDAPVTVTAILRRDRRSAVR